MKGTIPTKPFVAATAEGSFQSYRPEVVCAIVEIADGGTVRAYPGFEDALAEEATRRGFTQIDDATWMLGGAIQ